MHLLQSVILEPDVKEERRVVQSGDLVRVRACNSVLCFFVFLKLNFIWSLKSQIKEVFDSFCLVDKFYQMEDFKNSLIWLHVKFS